MSNIAESINSALKPARGFPISFLLEFIREKLGKWYWKRREDALSLTSKHSRGIERLLAIRSEIADTMFVQPIDGWKFFVTGGKRNCIVDLQQIKCDCGVYGIEKIPCSHAIAAETFAKLHIASLVSPLYSSENLYTGSANVFHRKYSVVRVDKRSQDGNLGAQGLQVLKLQTTWSYTSKLQPT
ncbi:unnamed protein product, partial [Brassica oleracea]